MTKGKLPEVGVSFSDAHKANSDQWAKVTLTYLGPDKEGRGRFQLKGKCWNKKEIDGDTFLFLTVLKSEDGTPIYLHAAKLGVNAGFFGTATNKRTWNFTVPYAVAEKVAEVELRVDPNANSNRVEKQVFGAISDGILKGIKDGVAELVKKKLISFG